MTSTRTSSDNPLPDRSRVSLCALIRKNHALAPQTCYIQEDGAEMRKCYGKERIAGAFGAS